MRAIIQRVLRASVSVNEQQVSAINQGLLVLIGITHDDTADDAKFMYVSMVSTSLSV
jgi:D-aminoacyl-tRNA deacylase